MIIVMLEEKVVHQPSFCATEPGRQWVKLSNATPGVILSEANILKYWKT